MLKSPCRATAWLTAPRCITVLTKATLATEKIIHWPNEGLLQAKLSAKNPFSMQTSPAAVQACARLCSSLPIWAAVKLDHAKQKSWIISSFPRANQVKGKHLSFIGFSFHKLVFIDQALIEVMDCGWKKSLLFPFSTTLSTHQPLENVPPSSPWSNLRY